MMQLRQWGRVMGVLAAAAVLSAGLAACETTEADANQAVRLVNASRAEVGVPPVGSNVLLWQSADRWAQQMRDEWVAGGCGNTDPVLRHTRLAAFHKPARVTKAWKMIGENVGVATVLDGDRAAAIESLHRAYVASPPHYANIVDRRFRWTGQAVVYGPTSAQSAAGACPGVPPGSMAWSVQVFLG